MRSPPKREPCDTITPSESRANSTSARILNDAPSVRTAGLGPFSLVAIRLLATARLRSRHADHAASPPPRASPQLDRTAFQPVRREPPQCVRMEQLAGAPSVDLYAPIPHGDGQTTIREALLVADHNAYHLGQWLWSEKE
jgi:hypothetical protein